MPLQTQTSKQKFKPKPADKIQAEITQNALPSKGESIEGQRVGVVGRHYSESFVLFCEFEALGDGVIESDSLMEGHVGPAGVVGLVDSPPWTHA